MHFLDRTMMNVFGAVEVELTKNWFLVSSPTPTLRAIAVYLLTAVYLGPWLMRDRKPFGLRKTMLAYNLFQTLFSFWMFWSAYKYEWSVAKNIFCIPLRDTFEALPIASVTWWYHFSKFVDFLDTIFFIMRKKNNQLTFLHIYHHAVMPLNCYLYCRFTPSGNATFVVLVNSLIHTIMYFYYFLAAFGPKMQPFLWWKKYLTQLQLIQFLSAILQFFGTVLTACEYPIVYTYSALVQGIIFFCLFYKFYMKSYQSKKKTRSQ